MLSHTETLKNVNILTDVPADAVQGKVVLSNLSPILNELVDITYINFKLFDTIDITNSSD